ncbi:mitochondrial thiamine pyrophosphate carrier-like [Gigantopelta aegis]|uniref:mitochondrial thiamine pyrophosphate carrier-like n=1 Tax=Gigantopelta aegis TaxID=1735272 RepID=UPI001B887436|nr:mitochondrial thiamine pyrophosphate carrier-like [Gigantopelta aegis]
MVGYNPQNEIHLSHKEFAFAGALSGAISRVVAQPLDVLKIRFQLQVDPIQQSQGSLYQGLIHAVRKIAVEEGISAFWKGHVPAQALSIFYGIAQYTFFEALTKGSWYLMPESLNAEWRPVTHTVCGGLSGCISTFVVQPIDVIRTRFVAQGGTKIYFNVYQAFFHIAHQEGVRGFYRGLTPALLQIAPQMGLQFGLYSFFTLMWDNIKGTTSFKIPGPVESFFCGTGAGFLSKMIVYPLDVIKKRLQIQGFEKARKNFGTFHTYYGFLHCCRHIVLNEGIRGLYKGLLPSVLKAGVVSGTIFCVYDQIIAVLILLHR